MIPFSSPTLKFSVSGLRGVVPADLNALNLPFLVAAFEKSLGKGKIAVARDTRATGEFIENITIGALAGLGRDVVSLGIAPTPTIKAYIARNKLAGGIMISASHNPPEYNAFKLIKSGGFFFDEEENQVFTRYLREIIQNPAPAKNDSYHAGKIHRTAAGKENEAYQQHIDSVIRRVLPSGVAGDIKVAIDPVSAAASEIAPMFLSRLGIPFVAVHGEFRNEFPRKPEPTPDALKKLSALVKNEKCDIGFAFDPDADRLALVGPDGKPLGEEYTLAISLDEFYHRHSGPAVINLSTSWVNEFIGLRTGNDIYRSKVGEANVVAMMREKKAKFGGEGNGGVIDPAIPSYGRDSLAAMAYILGSLSRRPLAETLAGFPVLSMEKMVVRLEGNNPKEVTAWLRKTSDKIRKKYKDFQLDTSDGYRFAPTEGLPWIHIRSSNTEPIIRVIVEAHSGKETREILQYLSS